MKKKVTLVTSDPALDNYSVMENFVIGLFAPDNSPCEQATPHAMRAVLLANATDTTRVGLRASGADAQL